MKTETRPMVTLWMRSIVVSTSLKSRLRWYCPVPWIRLSKDYCVRWTGPRMRRINWL